MSTTSYHHMTTRRYGCHNVSTFRGDFHNDEIFDHINKVVITRQLI